METRGETQSRHRAGPRWMPFFLCAMLVGGCASSGFQRDTEKAEANAEANADTKSEPRAEPKAEGVTDVIAQAAPSDSTDMEMLLTDDRSGDGLPALPPAEREFRGVWITTINNGDWPSRRDLTSAQQQSELIQILDRAKSLNLNAVILQVRPVADAFYESALEPWSVYLTGEQGKAPVPFYDPLKFAIEEAHKRGLELHAWFNSYRAGFISSDSDFAPNHVALSDMVVKYGRYVWLDPGNPDAMAQTLNVILDVLLRYDIDGIHIDDYAYPYPEVDKSGKHIEFPDEESWARSNAVAAGLTRDEWRRENLNRLVRAIHEAAREIKPWVKFGISPFGIWKPGYPDGVAGLSAFDELYVDARKWIMNGWVDYLSPQLYWAVSSPAQSYPSLLSWWIEQNQLNRHIWPGNFASRITLSGSDYWDSDELVRQIEVTRLTRGAGGNVLFRMNALMPAEHQMGDILAQNVYAYPVMVPQSPWMKAEILPVPVLTLRPEKQVVEAELSGTDGTDVKYWLVRFLSDGIWTLKIYPGTISTLSVSYDIDFRPTALAFSAVDRIGREGVVVFQRIPR